MRGKFISFSIVLVVMGIIFVIHSNVFIIKKLDVEAKQLNCVDVSQIRDSSKILGQNFFRINSSKVENDLKKRFICIKAVTISKYFPDKLGVQVFGREPAAVLVSLKSDQATGAAILEKFTVAQDSASESFVVDSEGIIYSANIDQQNIPNIPKIYFTQGNLYLGQKLATGLIGNALKILEKIHSFGIDVTEAKIYSKNILLVNSMPRIILKLDDKVDTQLASLQLILKQAKIDEAKLEFIDLRFDKPIVRFAPKKDG